MPVNVASDIFVVIPRSDNRKSDSVSLFVFAEREVVEYNGDFDDCESSGGSAAVMVIRRGRRKSETRREGVSSIVAWREK
jgi:threonine synthase